MDFARELSSNFKSLAQEEEKTRKKKEKREVQERGRDDIRKISYILEIQVSSET